MEGADPAQRDKKAGETPARRFRRAPTQRGEDSPRQSKAQGASRGGGKPGRRSQSQRRGPSIEEAPDHRLQAGARYLSTARSTAHRSQAHQDKRQNSEHPRVRGD